MHEKRLFGRLSAVHLRTVHQAGGSPQGVARLYECCQRVVIFVCFTRRFPLFWGAWEELLSVTVTRSDLLFVLKHTDDSVIRDLFWIALMNRMNEVGTLFGLHRRLAFLLRC